MALLLAFFLDFGNPNSPCMNEFQVVTPTTMAAAGTPGWVQIDDAQVLDQHYPLPEGELKSAPDEPPVIYTNDLTRDGIASLKPARLELPLPAGEYTLWAVAGDPTRGSGRLYDFELSAGDGQVRFQMEEGQWYETRRLTFRSTGPQLTIDLTPRGRWILNGLVIARAEDFAAIDEQLQVLDDAVYKLPPEVMAVWSDLPRPRPRVAEPTWTEASKKRGYLLHQRHYLENVYPDTVPYGATIDPQLRCFATLGEAEPLTFSVLPLHELTGCMVTAGDLKGPNGTTIPESAIDVKQAVYNLVRPHYTVQGKYRTVPDYLRPVVPSTIAANVNQRYWLTVTVPDNVPGGIYQGEVTFKPGNAPPSRLPVSVRVLPFKLQQDPGVVYGMYYRDPLEKAARADDPVAKEYYTKQAETQAQDMNAHGTVLNVPLSAYVSVPNDPQAPIELTTDWELLTQRIDRCRRYGYDGPYIISTNTGGLYRRHNGGQGYGSHLADAKALPEAFATEYTQMIAYLEAGRKERQLGEWLYYPVDEPGRNPDQVAFMVQCLKAIQAGGGRTYVTADPTHEAFEPMRPYVHVWCTQPFLPDRETILADMKARDVEYWCYPNHVNGENDHTVVAGARMTYGFGFWRSGFKVLIPWIYGYSQGSPYNDLDGTRADFFNRPGPDGTVWPVPMYEAYREGYDDFRYVYTLQQAIKAAGNTPAAKQAQAVLDEVWNAIEVKAKYKEDEDVWGYREFDLRRWQIASQILKLGG